MDVPQDPIILVSFVNTKLRDQFATLEELCQTYELNQAELCQKLDNIDYQKADPTNQYV